MLELNLYYTRTFNFKVNLTLFFLNTTSCVKARIFSQKLPHTEILLILLKEQTIHRLYSLSRARASQSTTASLAFLRRQTSGQFRGDVWSALQDTQTLLAL